MDCSDGSEACVYDGCESTGSLADWLKLIDGRANVRQVDFNARFRQPRQFHPPVTWAVIRVYDDTGNVIETQEHKGDFKEW